MGKLQHKRTILAKNVAEKTKPKEANIYDVITYEAQLYRVSQDISKLRLATTAAESIMWPQRYLLYQTYADAVLDAHLTGAWENRKAMTMSREMNFFKPDGTIDEKASEILKTEWFSDLISHALDSKLWGFSVIQLGDVVENGFTYSELIPRIYVKPEYHLVTETYTGFTGQDYRDEPYKWWVVPVGKDKDLGILNKASYHAIWKKAALGAWAEYNQIFGVPTRLLETDATDAETMKAADRMMQNWSSKQYLITSKQDKLTFVEANRSDAFNVFDKMIDRANSEISKLILGQTSTMDEKSFSGSSAVHERGANKIMHKDTFFIESLINSKLKPILEYHGFPVKDLKFKITDNQDVELEEKIKIDLALIASQKYTLSAEYIKEHYGSEVELAPTSDVNEPTSVKSIKNALDGLYD